MKQLEAPESSRTWMLQVLVFIERMKELLFHIPASVAVYEVAQFSSCNPWIELLISFPEVQWGQ
jgi:hypothetical protein